MRSSRAKNLRLREESTCIRRTEGRKHRAKNEAKRRVIRYGGEEKRPATPCENHPWEVLAGKQKHLDSWGAWLMKLLTRIKPFIMFAPVPDRYRHRYRWAVAVARGASRLSTSD